MLTVKICKPDGFEEVIEARSVTKEPHGVLVQNDLTQFFGRGGSEYGLDTDLRLNSTVPARLNQADGATVYVMNRFGATVSTYRI